MFNDRWDLMAVHHATVKYAGEWVNVGIRVDRIVETLRKELGGTETGRQVLRELGL